MRAAFVSLVVAATFGAAALSPSAFAQDNAAQEMAHRQAILARLPADAAKRVFGLAASPAPGPARAIGDYTKGCVAGAVQLPGDGPNWQVMRPSRKRALCREAGVDRAWLERIRPWWGHNYHFHIRLACPRGDTECHDQRPAPSGDGCGADLDWWFTQETKHLTPREPAIGPRVSELPAGCVALAR